MSVHSYSFLFTTFFCMTKMLNSQKMFNFRFFSSFITRFGRFIPIRLFSETICLSVYVYVWIFEKCLTFFSFFDVLRVFGVSMLSDYFREITVCLCACMYELSKNVCLFFMYYAFRGIRYYPTIYKKFLSVGVYVWDTNYVATLTNELDEFRLVSYSTKPWHKYAMLTFLWMSPNKWISYIMFFYDFRDICITWIQCTDFQHEYICICGKELL